MSFVALKFNNISPRRGVPETVIELVRLNGNRIDLNSLSENDVKTLLKHADKTETNKENFLNALEVASAEIYNATKKEIGNVILYPSKYSCKDNFKYREKMIENPYLPANTFLLLTDTEYGITAYRDENNNLKVLNGNMLKEIVVE